MKKSEVLWQRVQDLFDSLEKSQENRVWKVANKINPHFILDDLLNPQDHPKLVSSPEFNFEDGQLSGMRSARIAINSLIKELMEQEREGEGARLPVQPLFQDGRTRVYKAEPWGWNIKDTSANEIMSAIHHRSQGKETDSLVIFDLDGTLFDVGYRTIGILKEWLASPYAANFSNEIIERVAGIDFEHVGYSLAHAFENVGLDLRAAEIVEVFSSAEKMWKKMFFDGHTLTLFDKPMSGAVEFVNRVASSGFNIAYLSGRHDTVMREGTVTQLRKYGFPLNDKTQIFLKEDSATEDLHFKDHAFASLAQKYRVVGNFENEYVNLAAMAMTSPDTVHVIVDSQHSGRPVPPLRHAVYRIQHF